MRVQKLEIQNFRSFERLGPIELGPINVFIGPNNAGKSSVLRALHLMQQGPANLHEDVRVGVSDARLALSICGYQGVGALAKPGKGEGELEIRVGPNTNFAMKLRSAEGHASLSPVPAMEPDHLIVPYLSKRKAAGSHEDVRDTHARTIHPDLGFLAAKLARVGNPQYPGYEYYEAACKEILGFVVTAVPSVNGMRPGIYLADRQVMPLERMGEGVPNIVGLLTSLAVSVVSG